MLMEKKIKKKCLQQFVHVYDYALHLSRPDKFKKKQQQSLALLAKVMKKTNKKTPIIIILTRKAT